MVMKTKAIKTNMHNQQTFLQLPTNSFQPHQKFMGGIKKWAKITSFENPLRNTESATRNQTQIYFDLYKPRQWSHAPCV